MSYVLEALKKQEAEQNPDVAVSLSMVAERRHRYRLLTWLVGATLVVNAGILFWFLVWPQLQQDQSRTVAESKAAENAPSPAMDVPAASERPDPQTTTDIPTAAVAASAAVASDLANRQSAAALATTPAMAAQTAAEAARASADEDENPEQDRQLVQLDRLPPEVRSRFPGLAFSTHVYAEDRDLRAVVANGRRLTEGDSLRGVTIDEITETGVILAFDDYLIEVPVIGYWE